MTPLTSTTDDELIQRLRSGEERAFTEIYNRYWEKLLAIGYYHTRHKQAAEDIVHDVLMSLWVRKAELQIRSLQAYLATAVKFAVFKAISREKRRHTLVEEFTGELPGIEEKLDELFVQDYLSGIVEELPAKARLVFTYSRNHHLSIKEIAGKMDLSPKAVEYHMTKALRSLRNALQKIRPFFI